MLSLSDWLALRERADHAARSTALTKHVAEHLPHGETLRAVDLGAGRGSNIRYVAAYMPAGQDWLLVDEDRQLLDEAAALTANTPGVTRVLTRQVDLGRRTAECVAGRRLVTASALLDLVSCDWIERLAGLCRAEGAAVLFALTYNGESRCAPVEPEDDLVRDLLNRHQQANDKGFGRAAGPGAIDCAARAFAAAGYAVERARSEWDLAPDAADLQRELVLGWASAGREIAPERSPVIESWLARRIGHIEEGRSEIVVGHEDVGAWLPDPPAPPYGRR